jgi:hypothetical protein
MFSTIPWNNNLPVDKRWSRSNPDGAFEHYFVNMRGRHCDQPGIFIWERDALPYYNGFRYECSTCRLKENSYAGFGMWRLSDVWDHLNEHGAAGDHIPREAWSALHTNSLLHIKSRGCT